MTRALMLGASGFVGAHLVRHLCAQPGTAVRALARETSDLSLTEGLPVDVCHGDVLDPASLKPAMRDVDLVYHCVVNARAWLRDPAILFRTNVDGLRNSLQVAECAGVRRFVLTVDTNAFSGSRCRRHNARESDGGPQPAAGQMVSRM